jgi:3'(2'), 5'-bisphosphate nucleotidase
VFVPRTGVFTDNVALGRDGRPVAGCVYAPARDRMFVGGTSAAAGTVRPGDDVRGLAPVTTRPYPPDGVVAVTSRSHLDDDTRAFVERVGAVSTRDAGSSLKFCLVAAGEADVYPRFGPTMEWDTAAGHAVLSAAGGQVLRPDGSPFGYGKAAEGFRNGAFVAWGGPPLI